MTSAIRALALASFAFLAACATKPLPPSEAPLPPPPVSAPSPIVQPTPPAPVGPNARAIGVTVQAPQVLKAEEAQRALSAFQTSCPVLVRRQDASLLTQGSDWTGLCSQASTLAPENKAYARAYIEASRPNARDDAFQASLTFGVDSSDFDK